VIALDVTAYPTVEVTQSAVAIKKPRRMSGGANFSSSY
jgi:hypothetical protein